MARDFFEDLRASQDPQLQGILNVVYHRFFPDSTVERLEYDDSNEFQRSGRDLRVCLRKPGRGLFDTIFFETIEEKIRSPERSCFDDLLVEYLSNVEMKTLGWIYTSKAEWLSYVRQPQGVVDVLILPMQNLRQWFIPRQHCYKDAPPAETRVGGATYHTANKIVPFTDRMFRNFLNSHGWRHFRYSQEGRDLTERNGQRQFEIDAHPAQEDK